ncbi:MAG: cell division protein FtsL [Pseudomonadales bacterium]|nr:cell division protein FtsL [Pseudomonadales bacterium]MCP5185356.1 cell division protein FtsL [Pseudomonadales bacterium]
MKAGWQYLLWSVLALGVCASALWVVNTSHEIRQMHKRMQAARESYDEQLAMQSRLLLERSAAAALPQVEKIATERLAMQFPTDIRRVFP